MNVSIGVRLVPFHSLYKELNSLNNLSVYWSTQGSIIQHTSGAQTFSGDIKVRYIELLTPEMQTSLITLLKHFDKVNLVFFHLMPTNSVHNRVRIEKYDELWPQVENHIREQHAEVWYVPK